ncbi:MAG TPA: excinuclease ABC subunit UvrC [Candidatus Hydrogenedentes bacterium]|nr:excinuclease ABC subunit UvrC [Candidatus Hydrogenedentota bacterium]
MAPEKERSDGQSPHTGPIFAEPGATRGADPAPENFPAAAKSQVLHDASAGLDLSAAPTDPGCYLMRDAQGRVLYVGKARNLRARIRAYFNETDSRPSVRFLMRRVASVEYIVMHSEKEALLLENTLIKEHRPRYNVRLKDDKNFLCLRLHPGETYPRLTLVRRFARDGARYFGPFHDARAARQTLRRLQKLFPLRTCSDHVLRSRTRPCLYHQLGQCVAPCVGLTTPEAYSRLVEECLLALEGRNAQLERELLDRIKTLSDELRFEEAAVLRDRLLDLRKTFEPQAAVLDANPEDRDVFGAYVEGRYAELLALHYRAGRLLASRDFAVDLRDLELDDALPGLILQFYEMTPVIPAEVLISRPVSDVESLSEALSERRGARVTVHCPRRGMKRELTDLADENAKKRFLEKRLSRQAAEAALEEVRQFLRLPRFPERIECFDISTFQGDKTVAAMAVFEHSEPAPSRHRRYIISAEAAGDDFMALREAALRRFRRARDEEDYPDLALIDGGKGQLGVVAAALEDLGIADRVPLAAIAKERSGKDGAEQDRFFIPGRANPVTPPKTSAGLRLLARIRDEAHRIAVSYHRKRRKTSALTTALAEIPGVGPVRARALLRAFHSVEEIRRASVESLAAVPGISEKLARTIAEHLQRKGERG